MTRTLVAGVGEGVRVGVGGTGVGVGGGGAGVAVGAAAVAVGWVGAWVDSAAPNDGAIGATAAGEAPPRPGDVSATATSTGLVVAATVAVSLANVGAGASAVRQLVGGYGIPATSRPTGVGVGMLRVDVAPGDEVGVAAGVAVSGTAAVGGVDVGAAACAVAAMARGVEATVGVTVGVAPP